jgi:hypothetical protein
MTDGNAKIKKWTKFEKIVIETDVRIPDEWLDGRHIDDNDIAEIAFSADLTTELEDAVFPYCDDDALYFDVHSHIVNGHVRVRIYGEREIVVHEGDA